MKISIVIPCFNEEKGIEETIESCKRQTVEPYEIIVIDDCSTDNTQKIIEKAEKKHSNVRGLYLEENTGLKSKALEKGIAVVTGDVFVTLDGDSLLDKHFVAYVKEAFEEDDSIKAFSGFIVSRTHNWLTASRAFEYQLAQHIFKRAQDILGYIYVMPGCASAYETKYFKKNIDFHHDSLAEDLDVTFRYHFEGQNIYFSTKALVYTQDPANLQCYVNQLRRWYGGAWQCIFKYPSKILEKPILTMIIGLMVFEGIFAMTLILMFAYYDVTKIGIAMILNIAVMGLGGFILAIARKKSNLFYGSLVYPLVHTINIYVLLEQFFVQMFNDQQSLVWVKPERY